MSIKIGDRVKVLGMTGKDFSGTGTERIGQVGEVVNDYSDYGEEFPYGVKFPTSGKYGDHSGAFEADELEVVK